MRFHSALSTTRDLGSACDEIAASVSAALGPGPVDLLLVFAAAAHADLEHLPELLTTRLPTRRLVGSSGSGVLAGHREVEDGHALAVLAGRLPQVGIHARRLTAAELPDPDAPPSAWCEAIGLPRDQARGFVLLPDPFSFPVTRLVDGLDYAYPDALKIGGLSSGGGSPGTNTLFCDDEVAKSGAIVLGLSGRVRLEAIVAQGCKPVGGSGTVTRCVGHEILTVDGKPALRFLQEQLDLLEPADLALARRAPMFLGMGMDPFAATVPNAGEFLIRQILGLDRNSGALAIGGAPRVGRKVRFHLRDRATSSDDLERMLQRVDVAPAGALLFSCLGRGVHLYGERDHDSATFQRIVGNVPLAGFFCNGEIGPVGGVTHLHGYTSVFGLLREVST